MTRPRDPMTDALRSLADAEQGPVLSDAEIERLLAAIPEPVPQRPAWARAAGWGALAAAAVVALWLLPDAVLPSPPPAPETAETVADATPNEPREVLEMRLATADPSIEIVWIASSDFEIR